MGSAATCHPERYRFWLAQRCSRVSGTRGGSASSASRVLGDFARPNPFVLAPTFVLAYRQFPIPVRLGLGVPIFLGPTSATSGFGAILKLMLRVQR